MQYERERSLKEAQKRFISEVKKLGLNFKLKKFGDFPTQAVACYLFCQKTKKKVSEGGGKGIGFQSELSAKFEALEVFTGQISRVGSAFEWLSLFEIRSLNLPLLNSQIFPELLESDFPRQKEKMPWVLYQRYGTDEQRFVPAICTHPFYDRKPLSGDNFDYSGLYLSATTNGFATGCTFNEALIHAILEVIERHSLSLFMIETFLREKPKTPKIIDIQSLPISLQEIAAGIVKTTGFDLLLYQMPNEISLPVYGAILYHEDLPFPIKGCGASLDAEYAIERALLEALEVFYWDKNGEETKMALKRLANFPKFKKCAEFNLPELIKEKAVQLSPFSPEAFKIDSTEDYLKQLLKLLDIGNFSLYVNETYHSENITTVHVILPEAEDFFVVLDGLLVPIKAKGMNGLN